MGTIRHYSRLTTDGGGKQVSPTRTIWWRSQKGQALLIANDADDVNGALK